MVLGLSPHLATTSLRAILRVVPDGTPIPILSGTLCGYWFTRSRRFEDYTRGTYEPHVQQALVQRLRQGDAFWDLGAHQGFHTLLAASRVGHAGQVVAVEPRPENADRIWRHLTLNRLAKIAILVCAAASDQDGEAEFHQCQDATDHAKLADIRSHPEWGTDQWEAVRVRTVTMDQLRLRVRQPTLIKIDVEGEPEP